MKRHSRRIGKRLLASLLSALMVLSMLPVNTLAEEIETTSDIGQLMTDLVVEGDGLTQNEDGSYNVRAKEPYNLKMTFVENDKLEFDMDESISFELPKGVAALFASGSTDIYVSLASATVSITNDYVVDVVDDVNVITITWNKDDKYFQDLAAAHYVNFVFDMNLEFDGTTDIVTFNSGKDIIFNVDTSGKVIVEKAISGIDPAKLSEEQKNAMTFALMRKGKGENEDDTIVGTFSYAQMTNGKFEYSPLEPGDYYVVETGNPTVPLYYLDTANSTTTKEGTLEPAGELTLSLTNVYEPEVGDLKITKEVDWQSVTGMIADPFDNEKKEKISFRIYSADTGYDETFKLSDPEFGTGALSLTGLKVGTYTITETGDIAGYDWTYKINDQAAASPTTTVEVTSTKTAETKFDNTYKPHLGTLVVKKEATGGATVPDETTFTVTYPDGTTTTSFTYSQMTSGSYTLSNVPLGTYIVEENDGTGNVDNYTMTVSISNQGEVKLEAKGDEKTATITNNYTPVGNLEITKAITGELPNPLTADQEALLKAIKFTVYRVEGTKETKVGDPITYADILAGQGIIQNLPVGTYRVKETSADIPGYTLTVTPSSKEQEVNVTIGETATAAFSNDYKHDEFKITIDKTITGLYDAATILGTDYKNTKFVIKNKSGKEVGTFTLEQVLNNQAVYTTDIYAGPYTVTEVMDGINIPGVSQTTEVKSSTVNGNEPITGTQTTSSPENHKPATVSFTNDYFNKGVLDLKKTVVGLLEPEEAKLRQELLFTIFSADNNTAVFQGLKLADLSDFILPEGKYYIQESSSLFVRGYDDPKISSTVKVTSESGQVATYTKPASFDSDNIYTEEFTVVKGDKISVSFTNDYGRNYGPGKVSYDKYPKYIKGLPGCENQEIELIKGKYKQGSSETALDLFDSIRFRVEIFSAIDNQWHLFNYYSIQDILDGKLKLLDATTEANPNGTFRYRIKEENGAVEGYVLHVGFLLGGDATGVTQETWDTIEFSATGKEEIRFEAHNVYGKVGDLTIKKTITGLPDDLAALSTANKKKIKFKLEGPYDYVYEFTYADFKADGTLTIKDLPVGTYTLTETGHYTHTLYNWSFSSEGLTAKTGVRYGGTVDITSGETSDADITNTYERKIGDVTVTKVFGTDGDVKAEDLTEAEKKAMLYELVETVDNKEKIVASATYDLFTDGKYTFKDVPTGTYTLRETLGDIIKNNYEVTIVCEGPGTISQDKTTSTFTLKDKDKLSFTITNTMEKTGVLELKKTFDGETITYNQKKVITFTVTGPEGYSKTFTIGKDFAPVGKDSTEYVLTLKNLVPGTYTVTESADATEFKRITTISVSVNGGSTKQVQGAATGSITVGFKAPVTVSYKNTYSTYTDLRIYKNIDSGIPNMTDGQKEAMEFKVTDEEGNVKGTFTYKDMLDNDGVYVLTEIPVGKYTVTETLKDPTGILFAGYTCGTKFTCGKAGDTKPASGTGTVAAFTTVNGEYEVMFTNTFTPVTPLKVVKSVANNGKPNGWFMNGNLKYPVWQFTLTITDLTPATTVDGSTTMTDVFDAAYDWFRLATDREVEAADLGLTAYKMESAVAGKSAPNAVFDEDTMSIKITEVTEDTASSCMFIYFLTVKDEVILMQMNTLDETPATRRDLSGKDYHFNNVVEYQPRPWDPALVKTNADYYYEFTAVDKEVTNVSNGKLVMKDGNKEYDTDRADYTIVLNKEGISIGNRSYITATDTFSDNQTVLLSTIVTVPSEGVSYVVDNDAHTITFTIPNNTPVVVTYQAWVNGDYAGNAELKNDVELAGFVDGVDVTARRRMAATGGGALYSLTLIKVNRYNHAEHLADAEFDLYDEQGQLQAHFKTAANGQLEISRWVGNDTSFKINKDYYLVETKAPAGCYAPDGTEYWFRFSDNPEDIGSRIPSNGHIVTILNNGAEVIFNNEPAEINLEVTKFMDNWDLVTDSFDFLLKAVGDAPMPAPGGEYANATMDEPTAVFGVIRFKEPGLYAYTIQEVTDPAGRNPCITYNTRACSVLVEVTGDDNGILAITITYEGEESLTIANEYPVIDITFIKEWDDDDDRELLRDAYGVTLYMKTSAMSDSAPVGSEVLLDKDTLTYTWADLPKYFEGQEILYTVEETTVPVGYTPEITGSMSVGYVIENVHEIETVEIPVTKFWEDDENAAGRRPTAITLNIYQDGSTVPYRTVDIAGSKNGATWSYVFRNLPKYSSGTTPIVYTIGEENISYYYPEIKGYEITNTYIPTVETVSIRKVDENGKDLGGAVLQVNVKGNPTPVVTWNSGEGVKQLELLPGDYVLSEISVPDGYVKAEDIAFTIVVEDGHPVVYADGAAVSEVVMVDKETRVSISKQDITSGKEIGGARLQIRDKNGKIVEEWISEEGKSHLINAKLLAGETYTLVETQAPEGYEAAESIKFTVNADGTVTTVVMKDAPVKGPNTGDHNSSALWISLMALSTACILVTIFQKRRRKTQ